MNNPIQLELRAGYLLAILPPNLELTRAVLAAFWPEVIALCQEHNVTKILSIGPKPIRKMNTMDAYDSGLMATAIPLGMQVAFCWEGYEPDDLTRFFQSVAANRGTTIEFFPSAAAGMAWLEIPYEDLALVGSKSRE